MIEAIINASIVISMLFGTVIIALVITLLTQVF